MNRQLFINIFRQITSKFEQWKTFPCENILYKVENVRLIDRFNLRQQIIGTIYLTSTHLIFADLEATRETWILHSLLLSVDILPITQQGCPLRIRTKHFFSAEFIIPKEQDRTQLHYTLNQLKLDSYDKLYCFLYQAPNYLEKVWVPFELEKEYMRMGIPNAEWRKEDGNGSGNFEICDTYPSVIYVPATATKAMIIASSKFRSRGRLPALSYLHSNGASITRCSQPLSGFSARCSEDEQLLQCILRTNSHSNTMYIIDTRPRINAVANRATGKGYENEGYYSNIQFKFCPIENIHTMRNSLQKLLEVCELKNPTMNQYLSALDNTGWLQHIKAVLDSAIFIARAIEIERKNVLVHCSDGWDRTAQCCSLVSLLLCPYYRSIHGFRMLIEREWLSFGHKFSDRCGHLRTNDNKEQAPVFLQFIESVWQLTHMYPTAFEFNERFLISLHDHSHSCQYGNFIGNCEKDRIDLYIKERTYSYWNYVLQNVNDFKNPLFRPQSTYANEVLLPNIYPQSLKLWVNMYHRFDSSLLPKDNIPNILTHLIDHSTSLSDHARLLERRIRELRTALENGTVNELTRTSSTEVDSGPSENELSPTKTEPIPIKSSAVIHPLSSPSEADSSVSGSLPRRRKSAQQQSSPRHRLNTELSESLTLDRVVFELSSIALDWRSYHTSVQCNCALPFDSAQRKYNCWKCGDNFCVRCIEHGTRLPGLYSNSLAPVCKNCVRSIRASPFFIDSSASNKSSSRNQPDVKSLSVVS